MTHRHCAKKASRRSPARRCGRPMWMRGRVMMRNPADRFSKLVCAFFPYNFECTGRMWRVQHLTYQRAVIYKLHIERDDAWTLGRKKFAFTRTRRDALPLANGWIDKTRRFTAGEWPGWSG